jgi:hypothetical protein
LNEYRTLALVLQTNQFEAVLNAEKNRFAELSGICNRVIDVAFSGKVYEDVAFRQKIQRTYVSFVKPIIAALAKFGIHGTIGRIADPVDVLYEMSLFQTMADEMLADEPKSTRYDNDFRSIHE